jgi:hypothetical protein
MKGGFFMDIRHLRWRRLLLPILVISVLIIGGCGSGGSGEQVKTYSHDGYMGISNSNPSLPNRHSYWNYGRDGDLVAQTLRPLQGIQKISILTGGPNMRVKLKLDNRLSEHEKTDLLAHAQSLLDLNFAPRYHVKVVPDK